MIETLSDQVYTMHDDISGPMKEFTSQHSEPFKAIFEFATIAILLVDENGYIRLTNPHAEKLFGYSRGELLDQRIEILIPKEFRQNNNGLMKGYFDNPQYRSLGTGIELNALKKDGSVFPVEISLGHYNDSPTQMAIVFLTDITHRKHAEQVLYNDEKRLRDIIQSISDAFMGFTDDWRYLYINDKALNILNKTRQEILGKTIWEIFPHMLGEIFEHEFKKQQTGQMQPFTIKTNHGSTWWRVRVARYNGGMAFLCSDITEAMFANEAKHQSEMQFSTIFNSSPAAIAISELDTGIITDINESHTLLFGFSKQELIGKTVVESGMYKDFNDREKVIDSIRKKGPVRNFNSTVRTKNGNLVYLLISADIIHLDGKEYLLVASFDVSANKVAMDELKSSEERFAKAFRASPVALSISTRKDGKMIEVNNGFLELFGYTLKEVIGRTANELNMYPDLEERAKTITQLREQGYIRNKELICNTKTNAKINVIFSMEMIELHGEMCVITTALDITDKKKAEQKLKSYTDLLEQKVTERTLELTEALEREKEASDMKSRFVSIASHEFRTPLSTILSSTYLLEQMKDNEDDQKKHFNRIRSSVKNLTFILTEFLSLEKLEQRKVTVENELFDLDMLASEVIDEVRIAYRLILPVNYAHSGVTLIYQDKRIIKNILLNLVSNAAKYSPTDKIIKVSTLVNHDNLKINVIDEGIGIPLADQKNIFTKFFRAHNASHIQGTGLGLSISKRYVELLDGSIGFKSVPYGETEFEVILPIQKFRTDQKHST